jgi:selenide, water dikinase
MVTGSGCGARVDSATVPVISEALAFANMGLIPAGAYQNREFREHMIAFSKTVPRRLQDLLFDPQTSGGLLISVREDQCRELVSALKAEGIADAAQIGSIVDDTQEKIKVS